MAIVCAHSSMLVDLLAGTLAELQQTDLWNHLDDCRFCQEELERLTDDPDLKPWRRAQPINPAATGTQSSICRALVERMAQRPTSLDRQAEHGTRSEHAASTVRLQLEASRFAGDLGMLCGYRIRQEIGAGGMAVVFEAIDTQLDRTVAIKVLKREQSDPRSQERFVREARAIATLHHPHVVAIHSIGATPDGLPFFAMERMAGGCLARRIQQPEKVTPRQAAEWIAGVATGLAAAHRAGVIHRDIKPSNVLLSSDGDVAKLADFGLARLQSVSIEFTQAGTLLGTPAYMSPEHLLNPDAVDARSDIYALGVTLYETLTGEVPFRGALHTVLQHIQSDEPVWPRTLDATIPRDLETICMTAMQRLPSKRYATAQEFADDLHRWLRNEPIVARPVTRVERLLRWSARNPRVAGLAASTIVLLLLIVVGSIYAALSLREAARSLRVERDNLARANERIQTTADDAEQQRQIAVESLNSLVTRVQSELGSRPGTIKLREAILETAFAGLDKVTNHAGAELAGHTTVIAHLRKSEILDLLGQTTKALVEIDKAEALARAATQKSPTDRRAIADLADVLMLRADAHRKAFAYDQAETVYEQVVSLRERIASEQPNDRDTQQALATCVQRLADIHYNRSKWDKAEAGYRRLLDHHKNALKQFAGDRKIQRDLSLAQERLGTLTTTVGRTDEAVECFQQAIALNQSLLDIDPDNKLYRADRAYYNKRLASLFSQREDHDAADQSARDAIGYYVAVAASDPLDTDARMKVGAGWNTLFTVRLAAGNLEGAFEADRECVERFDALLHDYPETAKHAVLAAEAHYNLADVQIRLGRGADAVASLRRQIGAIEVGERAKDTAPGQFDATKRAAQSLCAALELALQGVDAINEKRESADLAHVARTFAMYECARSGDIEQALQLGEQILHHKATLPDARLTAQFGASRAYGLCFRRLTEDSASVATEPEPRVKQVVEGCVQALQQLIEEHPGLRTYVWSEPDLRTIRQHPEVRALFP